MESVCGGEAGGGGAVGLCRWANTRASGWMGGRGDTTEACSF